MKNFKPYIILIILSISIFGQLYSQKPIIRNISLKSSTVKDVITLSGSGFSTDPKDLVVYFGAGQGEIKYATENTIDVIVPAGAVYDKISVTNLNSNLTGISNDFFLLSYSGQDFVPEKSQHFELFTGGATNTGLFDMCNCDLDNDGLPDFVVSNDNGSGFYILQNKSQTNSVASSFKIINTSTPVAYVDCKDLNGDGKPELIGTRGGTPADRVFIFKNMSSPGNISFDPQFLSYSIAGAKGLFQVKANDLDGDGKVDIIVSDGTDNGNIASNQVIQILKNNSQGSYLSFETDPITLEITNDDKITEDDAFMQGSFSLDIKDLNNDGLPEIVTSPLAGNNICIFQNQSNPGMINFNNKTFLKLTGPLINLKLADLNKDQKPDLIVAKNDASQAINLFTNQSTASKLSFSAPQTINTGLIAWDLDVGDLNGDSYPDIGFSSVDQSNAFGVLINQGNAILSFKNYKLPTVIKNRPVTICDINGDGRPDISLGRTDNRLSVYINKNCVYPSINPEGDVSICEGLPLDIHATKGIGLSYTWSKGNNISTADLVYLNEDQSAIQTSTTGDYSVTVTSDDGACSQTSKELNVSLKTGFAPTQPTASNTGPGCIGNKIQLQATTELTNVNYNWSGPKGFSSTSPNPEINNIQIEQSGYYTLEIIDPNGCNSIKDSTLVELIVMPDIDVSGPAAICDGQNVQLSVGNWEGYTFSWFYNGTLLEGMKSSTITVNKTGDYQAKIISNGCFNESTNFNLSAISLPTASFEGPSEVCFGDPISLNNTSNIPIQKSVYYKWSFGDGNASTEKSPAYTYRKSGDYSITLKVGYENTSCIHETSQKVSVIEMAPVEIIYTAPKYCKGDSVKLEVSTSYPAILWSDESTDHFLYVSEPGEYTVHVKSELGCESTGSIKIDQHPETPLEIITESGDSVVFFGKEIQLVASDNFIDYDWTPGSSLSDSTISNPLAQPHRTTTYYLTAKDENYCYSMDSILVYVDGAGPHLNADKLFSPNGDSWNQFWEIEDIHSFNDNSLAIFNRAGQKVYEASPYLNEWDAKKDGNDLPEGVYYYVLKFKDSGTMQTGSILVVR